MAINIRVQARVVDLRKDKPKLSDIFLVDTNAWFWLSYRNSIFNNNPPKPYQLREYSKYIKQAFRTKSRLYHTGLNLAELAHLIERNELDRFNQAQVIANLSQLGLKDYRYNYPAERARVVQEIKDTWLDVQRYSSNLDIIVNDGLVNAALQRLETQLVDGYDLLMLAAAAKSGLSGVITDDADFGTVSELIVFTANQTLINAAASQGQLLSR